MVLEVPPAAELFPRLANMRLDRFERRIGADSSDKGVYILLLAAELDVVYSERRGIDMTAIRYRIDGLRRHYNAAYSSPPGY